MKVLTCGVFDLLHEGHLNLFRRCRALAGGQDFFIGVNTDLFVLDYKGIVPHDSEVTRLLNVRQHGFAFLHDNRMKEDLLRYLPDIIVVGSDWHERPYLLQIGVEQSWLDERGIAVCYVPYTKGVSSTQLRAARES